MCASDPTINTVFEGNQSTANWRSIQARRFTCRHSRFYTLYLSDGTSRTSGLHESRNQVISSLKHYMWPVDHDIAKSARSTERLKLDVWGRYRAAQAQRSPPRRHLIQRRDTLCVQVSPSQPVTYQFQERKSERMRVSGRVQLKRGLPDIHERELGGHRDTSFTAHCTSFESTTSSFPWHGRPSVS